MFMINWRKGDSDMKETGLSFKGEIRGCGSLGSS